MDTTDWSACDSGRSFAAIDFETATSQRSSACAVGVAIFNRGSPVDTRRLLICPPGNRYDPFNTALHGIGPADTGDSPPFPEIWDEVAGMIDEHLVVAHNTAFDMSVLRRSAERFNIAHPELLARHGYRLGRCDLSAYRPYSNAEPSARGSSRSLSAKDFTPRTEPDPDGLLYAAKIAFTGTLECMPRREAFQAAADAGAAPTGSVSKRTDYLVAGTIDLSRVGETGLSSMHRKALDLIAEGCQIQIIDEDQFVCLLAGTITHDSPDPT